MFSKEDITRFGNTPTPFYYYNLELLKATLHAVKESSSIYNYNVHYAFKANTNNTILELIQTYGLGADCVSGNEIKKAIECNYTSEQIVFAGVGKSDKEINIALDNNIFCFNCESIPELEVINELAKAKNKTAQIALRINPNVNANTHAYITTGLEENKFGINMWELEDVLVALADMDNIKFIGLHFHIGSQITDLNDFKGLCLRVNEIQEWFYERQIIVDHVNVGGGLGIDYENPAENPIPNFEAFFKLFNDFIALRPQQKLHFELGRSIVGQCGTLISKVLYVKKGVNTDFAIIDAGMTELIRPALYQAVHSINNLTSTSIEKKRYDVVGPICESSDCFGKALMLPTTKRGDIIAINSCGAYGEVMASQYNLRDLVKAVY
ncbi:MAG: diaminopimelate decarboxylase [Flavobacteriales bacterium]|nr:MAG: diaminopimelate decarboxylase [Flavobacteriales bacterium]